MVVVAVCIGLVVALQVMGFSELLVDSLVLLGTLGLFLAVMFFSFKPVGVKKAVRYRHGFCIDCGYDLRGTIPNGSSVTCPECGCVQVKTNERDHEV